MKNLIINIANEKSILQRSGNIVSLANKFECNILLCKQNKNANAKSLLSVVGLAIQNGDELNFTFEGKKEDRAYDYFLSNKDNI